ncbi:unnamed protein product [Owenia fusiformis]|uniref:E3 ubiquitin-protein ligase Hakai n=1 Tax=Owenia fusiformis TaxID=6347 RepID=A0A8S4QBS7_OWEFU|nr:unnamed protein product [Owenia fusiformis]
MENEELELGLDSESDGTSRQGNVRKDISLKLKSGRGRGRGRKAGRGRGRGRKAAHVVEKEESMDDEPERPSMAVQERRGSGVSEDEVPEPPPPLNPPSEPIHHGSKLQWDHKVNLIGEKVVDPLIHCCEYCQLPILIYGRMIPCKHVFCFDCAKQTEKNCRRCNDPVQRIEQSALGTVFICTHGGSKHGSSGCRRTYLSHRDLQAHYAHRHGEEVGKPSSQLASKPMFHLPHAQPQQQQQVHQQPHQQQQQQQQAHLAPAPRRQDPLSGYLNHTQSLPPTQAPPPGHMHQQAPGGHVQHVQAPQQHVPSQQQHVAPPPQQMLPQQPHSGNHAPVASRGPPGSNPDYHSISTIPVMASGSRSNLISIQIQDGGKRQQEYPKGPIPGGPGASYAQTGTHYPPSTYSGGTYQNSAPQGRTGGSSARFPGQYESSRPMSPHFASASSRGPWQDSQPRGPPPSGPRPGAAGMGPPPSRGPSDRYPSY